MNRSTLRFPFLSISLLVLAALGLENRVSAQTVTFFETGEEFAGPFPSWKDVKADYGAKGDGVTDDTAAIEAAMRDLRDVPKNAWVPLYFPTGTYRLTKTIKNERRQHTDWLGGQIIGEHPATTILSWDGPDGDWMWGLDAWYFKMSRLTFDGRKKAGAGLVRWNNFATYCELSDLWFRDIHGPGIRLGSGTTDHEGQAEHAVERCRFTRCRTGILTADWNTMDIYVWYCLFEDCGRGFCDQVLAGGNGGDRRCHVAILVDGVENSDVTYLNGGWGEFRRGGVVVKGGPVRAAGGRAPGQVALLLGALGNNEYRLIDVQSGGRVVAAGFRDETPKAGSRLDLGPDSAGALSVFGMSWAGTPSTTVPFINVGDFKGSLAYVGNGVNQPKHDITNVADQVMDAVPKESAVLALLADIRALRIEPPSARAAGVTDVKLFRLLIRVGEGRTGLVFRR